MTRFRIPASLRHLALHRCFSIAAAMGVLICRTALGAPIAWDAPQNIAGAADVSTEGAYYGSWSPANTTIPVGSVNGVQMRGDDLEISSSGFAGSAAAFGTHTTADATYNGLLQYGTWSNGTSATFTLNGTGRRPLTPGRQYLVQVWVSDARTEVNGRTETVSGSGTLSFKTASGMGQYVIGRFTADAASQSITLTANQSAQVNLVQVRDITPPEALTRFQRWKTLKYGIFSHYTYAVTGDVNTAANGFNAEAYANDVAQAGAQYVVWTAWHGNMFPMFPSKAAEKYGYGGRCSQRDTVSDMIDAVRAKGIRVFLYVHPYQPISPTNEIHNNYINELFAEVIDRYGPRIDGLWIDENQINGDQDSLVDYKRLMDTIKSRNPDIVTMHNGGQMYTADMGGPEVVNAWNFGWSECMYNYVNPGNGPGAEDMLRTMVLEAASNFEGGGVHWSVDGVLNGGLVETTRLFALGQYIAPIRASICETKPSTSFPPPYKDGRTISYNSVDWVATEALDDSKVYIHVLKPPAGTVLSLPNPADGKIFSSAKLLDSGNPVGLVQTLYDGVQLTLQGADTWNALDTVIELTVASKGGVGHVNDTSMDVTYTGGSWSYQTARGNGEFGNDARLATADGDSFTFTFSGTDVEYIATRGTDRGQVELYIDNVLQTTVDLSSGTAGSRQVAFSMSGLARGTHTLKGIKRSGTYMEVDCFKVSDLINDSDASMSGAYLVTTDYGTGAAGYAGPANWWQPGYNGANWITPAVSQYPGSEPLNDPTNNEPVSDYFDFTFTGTGVQIPLSSAYSWAYFYMKVDGVFHSNVQVQQGQVSTFSVSGLPPGTHTVRGITWKTTSDPSQPGINGFTVTRPDIWAAASNRGFGEIGDDVHYTDVNPGRFSWNFDGSGVEVITTRDSDARMAWFGVSGMGYSIGARRQNFSLARQTGTSVFSLPNLVPGSYNLSVTHGANTSGLNFSFARLAIDAVRVYKGQALAAPALQWGASGAGGTGTWDANTTANWFDGTSAVKWPAAGTTNLARFGGTAGTVTLSGTINANGLQFLSSGYTLQSGTLTLNGIAPTLTAATGVSATIGSTVAGSAGLIKNGTGSLTLSAANTFTGTTTINQGTLALQNTWQCSAFHTEGGAVLDLNVASGTRDAGSTTFTGRGTLRKTGTGELRWGTGTATFNLGSGGLIDVQGGTFVGGSNANEDWTTNLADLNVASGAIFSGVEANVRVDALSGAGTIKSGFNGAGYSVFTFGVDHGNGTFSGVLANDSTTGNFTKTGNGTQILSGANTYTGTTTVSGGTLLVNGSLAAASAVTVGNNATLGGTGTVGGAVTVQTGGTLAPGENGVGTLAVGSATGSGRLAIQIDGNSADRLNVTGNLDITNCTLDLSILAGGLTQLQYILASYGSLTGSQFSAVVGMPSGYQLSFDTANKRILLIGELTQAPRNLSAAGGIGRVMLGWQPTVTASETTYQIERATTSGGPYTVLTSTATGNSYTDTTVADGATYFYLVRVSAGGSVGPVSNEASATTAAAGTLPPPLTGTSNIGGYGSPSVAYSGGNYTLNGSGSGATLTADSGYFLYVPIVGDCTIVAKVNTLGGSNAARRAGVMFRQALATNSMEMATLVGPTRIYNTYRTSTGGTTSSSNNGSTTITAPRWLRIVRTGNSLRGAQSADGTTWTQFTARTITMSGTVYVGLFVCSGDTTTTIASTFSNVTITGGRPANLAATVALNQVNLTWTSVAGASGYNIKRATTSGGPYTTIGTSTTANYTDNLTGNGAPYYYVVSAVADTTGESVNSDEVIARPIMSTPAIALGLTATGGENQITLGWSPSANATSYLVGRATVVGGPLTTIATTAATSYDDTTTVNGVPYHYVIVAANSGGQSAPSSSATAVSSGSDNWTAATDGSWNAPANWQSGRTAFGAGATATFSPASAVTVTQNVPGLTLGGLAFNTANATLAGNPLTLDVASGTPAVTVATGVVATLTTDLNGTDGLSKTGPGQLAISGAWNYSGPTSISGGTLASGAAAGTSFSLNALALNGATLAAANAGDASLGNFQLRSDVTVGGTAQSVISADLRVIQNETRTFNVGATGDASGIDLLISGKLGHQSGSAWGYAVKSGAGTMEISGANDIGGMTVNAGKLILQDTGIGGMWNGGLVNNAQTELRVTTGNAITWNNQTLQGIGTFTKSGSGKLSLPGMNTFSGGTEIADGTLEITQPSADNGGFTSIGFGPVTIRSGGTLLSSGNWTTGNEWNNGAIGKITIDQGGTWHITGVGGTIRNGLELRGGQVTSTGQANADWGVIHVKSEITASGGQTSTIAVDTALSGPRSISVNAGSRLIISGNVHNQISTTGALTQTGPGTLVLTGTNTFTGALTASSGTVIINGSLGSSATAAAGATLGGSGTIAGAVSIAAGASLSPGDNGTGTLTADSASITGTLAIQLAGSAADRVNSTGNLDIANATLALSGNATGPEVIIASFGSLTGAAFANVTGLPNGYQVTCDISNNQIKLTAGFAGWIGPFGVSNPAVDADPDNDDIPNALEYVLGGDPSQPNSNIAPTFTTGGGNLVFTFPRVDASETTDITLVVEAGTTLGTWPETYTISPGVPSAGVSIQENGADPDAITVTIPQNTARFARLRVIVAP